ncbi:hypothetical protein FRC11_012765, partial [Ceratobasidium sp. 423]
MSGRPKSSRYVSQLKDMTSSKCREIDNDPHDDATDELPGKKVNKRKCANVQPYARKDRGAAPAEGSTWSTQLRKATAPGPGQSKSKTHPPVLLPPLVAQINSRNAETVEERAQNSLLSAASGAIAGVSEPPPVAGPSSSRDPP